MVVNSILDSLAVKTEWMIVNKSGKSLEMLIVFPGGWTNLLLVKKIHGIPGLDKL